MANAVARSIAIRNAIAARRASEGKTPVTAPVAKAPRPKVAKGLAFAGDEGKYALTVTKGEVDAAMGVEGARGSLEVGAAIVMVSPAVSQSVYEHGEGTVARTGTRVPGFAGVEALHADFGPGVFRKLWLDEQVLADMMGVEGFAEAFSVLQVVSDARQERRDARFERLRAAHGAKADQEVAVAA